jgi:hypothetical protein
MPSKRARSNTAAARDDHGITCSCPRCVGLRRYPQPSKCDWCGWVHAGDANNCPEKVAKEKEFFAGGLDNDAERGIVSHVPGNGQPVTGDEQWEHDPVIEWIVSLCERDIKAMTRMVRKESKNMSLKDMLDKKGGGAGNLLKGSDVPSRIKQVVVEVAEIRESPDGFTAAFIIDLKKEIYGAMAWAVNKTNAKAIIKMFGDDEKKLKGKKIKLDVISVRNPSTGDIVPSLAVSPRQ